MIVKGTRAYNAFGQWIFEINGEDTIPPLFVTYYQEKEKPLKGVPFKPAFYQRYAESFGGTLVLYE